MKSLVLVLILFIVSSCAQSSTDPSHNLLSPSDSITALGEPGDANHLLSKEMLKLIKKHYLKGLDSEIKITEQINDSLIDISINEFPGEVPPTSIYIPRYASIIGDLNGDHTEDIIVEVSYQGSGSANNFDDLFVFVQNNNSYSLLGEPVSDIELSGCEGDGFPGHFQLESIKNGFLLGKAKCYAELDALCCPTLEYSVRVKLEGEKLILNDKRFIEK